MIDSHAHLVTLDLERYPAIPLGKPPLQAIDIERHLTVEDALSAADRLGIERLVGVQRFHVYGYDNTYVLACARAHPARVAAVACIDATAANAGQTAAATMAAGARGLRFTAPARTDDVDWFAGPHARAVWEAASVAGASLCVHLFRWNSDPGVAALAKLLAAFPTVDVVLDHAGNVEIERDGYGLDALSALERYERLVVKLTAINFVPLRKAGGTPDAFVRATVDRFGPARVMWGSDVTQSLGTYDELVDEGRASAAGLRGSDAHAYLVTNAERIYFG
jgi:predicted TIM-barrel fold metal-dependent hydrolase